MRAYNRGVDITERLRHVKIEVMDDELAEVIRAKSGAVRLRIASGMYASARRMLMAHLRSQHPDWDEEQIQLEAGRRLSHGTSRSALDITGDRHNPRPDTRAGGLKVPRQSSSSALRSLQSRSTAILGCLLDNDSVLLPDRSRPRVPAGDVSNGATGLGPTAPCTAALRFHKLRSTAVCQGKLQRWQFFFNLSRSERRR